MPRILLRQPIQDETSFGQFVMTSPNHGVVLQFVKWALKIDAYSRNVTSAITTTVTQTVPGVGTLTATAAGDIAQKVKTEKTKES